MDKLKNKSRVAVKKATAKPKPKKKGSPPVHKTGKKHPGPSQNHLSRAQAEKKRKEIRTRKKK